MRNNDRSGHPSSTLDIQVKVSHPSEKRDSRTLTAVDKNIFLCVGGCLLGFGMVEEPSAGG